MSDTLQKICDDKLKEVHAMRARVGFTIIKQQALQAPAPRGFIKALQAKQNQPALIAEVKKKSPSKGIIRADFNHIEIAQAYEKAGAACLSVLTDEKYFAGKNEYFVDIREKVKLPMIRKDFMLEAYQIYESRAIGADCILLIIAALKPETALELEKTAHDLGMDVLLEVHNQAELEVALKMNSKLIGVNNRNLKTMEVSLETGKELAKLIPDNYMKVCESGINTNAEIQQMMAAGYKSFLVGESLMKQPDIEAATKKLLGNN